MAVEPLGLNGGMWNTDFQKNLVMAVCHYIWYGGNGTTYFQKTELCQCTIMSNVKEVLLSDSGRLRMKAVCCYVWNGEILD
jgi:hypothetical protein